MKSYVERFLIRYVSRLYILYFYRYIMDVGAFTALSLNENMLFILL